MNTYTCTWCQGTGTSGKYFDYTEETFVHIPCAICQATGKVEDRRHKKDRRESR